MFQKFADYLYYLLPSPFKRLRKSINQWYIFCKVLGAWYDEVKEDLLRAADETTIATCSDILLPYFAEDKGLYRYPDETNKSFRTRIAMFDEVEALGGTKKGIILAAMSLGYNNVEHIWLPEIGETEKWATFLLKVYEDLGNDLQLDFGVLIKEVRDKKESSSLDTYEKYFSANVKTNFQSGARYEAEFEIIFCDVKAPLGDTEFRTDYLTEIETVHDIQSELYKENLFGVISGLKPSGLFDFVGATYFYDCRKLDGSYLLDGSYNLDAAYGKIEAYYGDTEL